MISHAENYFPMRVHKGKTVEDVLSSLNPQQRETAEKLRTIIKETLPDTVESVKWGNIIYQLHDKNLAWLTAYTNHLDLGFFRGAQLDSEQLEGTGKALRHIKIRNKQDIDEAEIKRLLKKAAELK